MKTIFKIQDEAFEETSEESAHHGNSTERRHSRGQGEIRARPLGKASVNRSDLLAGRDD